MSIRFKQLANHFNSLKKQAYQYHPSQRTMQKKGQCRVHAVKCFCEHTSVPGNSTLREKLINKRQQTSIRKQTIQTLGTNMFYFNKYPSLSVFGLCSRPNKPKHCQRCSLASTLTFQMQNVCEMYRLASSNQPVDELYWDLHTVWWGSYIPYKRNISY